MFVMLLVPDGPQQAFGPPQTPPAQGAPGQAGPGQPVRLPPDLFKVPDGLEVTLWAASPLLHNPTNIDIDRDGRIWVAEGVRYRSHHARQPEGDRIVVLQDTDGDGKADSTHTFVQEPALIAPLGVSVIDNKIVVAQPPDLIVYTDVDRNLQFDPAVDKREVLLTGFQGINHDHSLHSVTVGPDGKWIFNAGNMRRDVHGQVRQDVPHLRLLSSEGPVGPFKFPHDPAEYAGKPSDDGHVYVGGFTVRMNPDGTNAEIIGHNYRNSYEQSVTSLGDVFQNDNDDPPACRVSWVMEYANFGFSSNDGQRTWQADRRPGQSIPVAEWRQDDPGMTPAGDVYGGGSPTGNVFYENGALGVVVGRDVPRGRAGAERDLLLPAGATGGGVRARPQDLHDLERQAAVCGVGFHRRQRHGQGRARDAVPAVGHRGRSRRRAVCQRLDRRRGSAATRIWTTPCPARSTASRRRASCREVPAFDADDGRRTDHRAAVARGQRPGDRIRRAEGARRRPR